jgi:hypothetical protein
MQRETYCRKPQSPHEGPDTRRSFGNPHNKIGDCGTGMSGLWPIPLLFVQSANTHEIVRKLIAVVLEPVTSHLVFRCEVLLLLLASKILCGGPSIRIRITKAANRDSLAEFHRIPALYPVAF